MYRFWEVLTRPLLEMVDARTIIEIGSDHGFQTSRLLSWAQGQDGVTVHVVDPLPKYDVDEWLDRFDTDVRFHRELSLNALPQIGAVDAVLIDGDHNWYTVVNELRLLERSASEASRLFPLVLAHDVGWPYGRRDLYYEPRTIPDAYRHPHERRGMRPGEPGLVEEGGLNPHLENAIHEGTLRNGVLTAIEDHLAESSFDLRLYRVAGINGIGVLVERGLVEAAPGLGEFLEGLPDGDVADQLLEAVEHDRLQVLIEGADRRLGLEGSLRTTREELGEARDQLRDVEQELSRVVSQLNEHKDRLQQVDEALQAERAAHEDARRDAAALKDRAERSQAQARDVREELERLTERLSRERAETARLSVAVRRAEVKAEETARAATTHRETVREREAELAALRADLERVTRQAEIEQYRYSRLRNRRLVRVALALATLARPLFRIVRRFRNRGRPPAAGTTSSAGEGGSHREPSSSGGRATSELADHEVVPDEPRTSALGLERPRQIDQPGHGEPMSEDQIQSLLSAVPVTVVIPVHNAGAELERCLRSVARNTNGLANLLLIDDASSEDRIAEILSAWADRPNVRVLHNDQNLGFTRTVNRGFAEAGGDDVVLLNSDTQVPPRWLQNLQQAAYRSPTIGTVTAVSDNAGAFSVPELGERTDLPPGWGVDDLGRLFLHGADRTYPSGPTGNGFCMYVKRSLLDDVGSFDAEAFPRGYGEENDFCMRAHERGWEHIVDDVTFVLHTREASFGEEKVALAEHGRQVLDERFPTYGQLVREFVGSPEMDAVRRRAASVLGQATAGAEYPRPRLLMVVQEGMGGTPAITRAHAQAVADHWETYLLRSNTKHLKFGRYVSGEWETLHQYDLGVPLRFTDRSDERYRAFVSGLFTRYGFELVHIRHLVKHTFDVPEIAAALQIPVVLSFHDHYFICPTFHLLDEEDRFCGGTCTAGQGKCRLPMDWVAESVPHLKHGWVTTWQQRVDQMLNHVDAVVTTSQSVRDVHLATYPRLEKVPFHVIAHGHDVHEQLQLAARPTAGEPVRVLVIGNLDVHKGAETLRQLRELDPRSDVVELHLLGDVPPEYQDLGTCHGRFENDELADHVAAIRPSVVAIPSITAETFNHVLTEAWSFGVPVIGSEMGAVGERLRARGGGWAVDPRDAHAILELVEQLRADSAEWDEKRASANLDDAPTLADMAVDYVDVYEAVLADGRAFGGHRRHRVDLVVHGVGGAHPGSTHVRLLSRFRHPGVRRDWVAGVADASGVNRTSARTTPDLLVVQRDAVPIEQVGDFLAAVQDRRVPLLLDLDDDLLSGVTPPGADVDVAAMAGPLRRLCGAAETVTVSTPHLAEIVNQFAERVIVVPNALDESLWFAPLPRDVTVRQAPSSGPLRALYVGSWTHAHDLDLLEPIVGSLGAQRFELHVVGGRHDDADWFHRIDVPEGCQDYRSFVPWVRRLAEEFDIGVAPVVDTPFARSKSDLKFLEYTAMKMPTIASDVAAYNRTVQHGVTGFLASQPGDWIDAIECLLDPTRRLEVTEAAYDYVRTQRILGKVAGDYRRVLATLISH